MEIFWLIVSLGFIIAAIIYSAYLSDEPKPREKTPLEKEKRQLESEIAETFSCLAEYQSLLHYAPNDADVTIEKEMVKSFKRLIFEKKKRLLEVKDAIDNQVEL